MDSEVMFILDVVVTAIFLIIALLSTLFGWTDPLRETGRA